MFASAPFGFFGDGEGAINPLPGGLAYTFEVGSALASWRFNADGSVSRQTFATSAYAHKWHRSLTPGIYYVRATVLSGITPGGDAVNTWILASSSPSWTLIAVSYDTESCSLLIEISTTADVADLVTSGTYDITADANTL